LRWKKKKTKTQKTQKKKKSPPKQEKKTKKKKNQKKKNKHRVQFLYSAFFSLKKTFGGGETGKQRGPLAKKSADLRADRKKVLIVDGSRGRKNL